MKLCRRETTGSCIKSCFGLFLKWILNWQLSIESSIWRFSCDFTNISVFFRPQGPSRLRTSHWVMWPLTRRWSPGAASRRTSPTASWSTWPGAWTPGAASCPTGSWCRTRCASWRQGSTTTWRWRRWRPWGRSRSTAPPSVWPLPPVREGNCQDVPSTSCCLLTLLLCFSPDAVPMEGRSGRRERPTGVGAQGRRTVPVSQPQVTGGSAQTENSEELPRYALALERRSFVSVL